MSTIGSEYSSHRRSLDELEKEYETGAKKSRDRERMREAKLEKNVAAIVRKKDEELETSVRSVKDEYESSMRDLAKSDRVERERLKQSLYDRSGRQSAAIEESARTDRDRALQAAADAEARSAKSLSDSERYQEERSAAQAERHEQEKEALVKSYRQQIADARGGEGESEKRSEREARKKITADAQAAIKLAQEEVAVERRRMKTLAETSDAVLKDRDRKATALLSTRLREKDLAVKSELGKNAEAERTSRELELQPLREKVMETAGLGRDAARAKNEARAGAIRELESEWNSKYANQSLAYDLEKQKIRADSEDADRLYGQRLATYMHESEAKTADKIARQTADHREQITSTALGYERSLDHVKRQAAHDKALTEQRLERERATASERQERAVATQAATYQDTLAKQRQAQQSQVRNLERVLNNKNSTDDPGEISAAAEQSVRELVTRQFDKTFQAEADRNARDREHLEENYRARLGDAIQDKQANAAALNRQNLKEQTLQRDTFVQHVADVEDNKRQMLNLASDSNAKMSESTLRTNERAMNEMRRHYEELIGSRDAENGARLQETRAQAEFEKRTMRREFQSQTSDVIRSYEKKLSEQRTKSDEVNGDLKAKLDRQTRETDKRVMQALADQARAHDHRMAELEAQSKDRERLISRQHEDELDKVKKANALLLSKKG